MQQDDFATVINHMYNEIIESIIEVSNGTNLLAEQLSDYANINKLEHRISQTVKRASFIAKNKSDAAIYLANSVRTSTTLEEAKRYYEAAKEHAEHAESIMSSIHDTLFIDEQAKLYSNNVNEKINKDVYDRLLKAIHDSHTNAKSTHTVTNAKEAKKHAKIARSIKQDLEKIRVHNKIEIERLIKPSNTRVSLIHDFTDLITPKPPVENKKNIVLFGIGIVAGLLFARKKMVSRA